MKDKDYLMIGGLALIVYLLLRRKSALSGGAGAPGGGSGGGCGCSGSATAPVNPWTGGTVPGCPSASPGPGVYTQGFGPYPPEASTTYNPPSSEAWAASGFHLGFDLSF